MGERPEEAGEAGALILPVAGEGVRRGRPLFDPGRGNREGGEGESGLGRLGRGGRGWRPSLGRGVRSRWATGPVGGEGLLLFLFLLCLFCFLFICLFSFLFYFI